MSSTLMLVGPHGSCERFVVFRDGAVEELNDMDLLHRLAVATGLDMDDFLYQRRLQSHPDQLDFPSMRKDLFGRGIGASCKPISRIDVYDAEPMAELSDEDARFKRHPEQRPDEFFLGNIDAGTFFRLTWQSRRLGDIAYDDSGHGLNRSIRPLFVTRDEVFNAGLPPEVIEAMTGEGNED